MFFCGILIACGCGHFFFHVYLSISHSLSVCCSLFLYLCLSLLLNMHLSLSLSSARHASLPLSLFLLLLPTSFLNLRIHLRLPHCTLARLRNTSAIRSFTVRFQLQDAIEDRRRQVKQARVHGGSHLPNTIKSIQPNPYRQIDSIGVDLTRPPRKRTPTNKWPDYFVQDEHGR